MDKPVILTGIRSNEEPQIGNYFGAMLPLIDMAINRSDEFNIHLFVPDLHSFTTPIDHTKLYDQTLATLRKFVAAGLPLDNPNVHIYRQSFISAHSELTVILNNFVYMGELNRMTQFKDKGDGKANVSVGLFDYPVLMAADILLYGATFVPVGDDQTQHLELTRNLAQRINKKFNQKLLNIPLEVNKQHQFFGKDQGLRIRDLVRPNKKMSKSADSAKGVIFLSDSPNLAAKKILSATTDDIGSINLDYNRQPGISNLLQIYALLTGETLSTIANHYAGETNYGNLKHQVAEQLKKFLIDFQEKLQNIDNQVLKAKLESSEKIMNIQARQTLKKIQKAIGIRS